MWATSVLREHLVKGYTANARRLEELQQTVRLVARVADRRTLSGDQAAALLNVVSDYSYALNLLDDYDHGRLPGSWAAGKRPSNAITPEEARGLVSILRQNFGGSDLFGVEKDQSLLSALAAIFQTANGREVYPSLEEKAAHRLYFLVKNHPFVDGNKRIGAALFLWFLEKNSGLYLSDGSRRLSEDALVAITLMVAESDPKDKQILTRLIVAVLARPLRPPKGAS
jgi:prophage maintenance system killer protein